jgi:hypothetical protein
MLIGNGSTNHTPLKLSPMKPTEKLAHLASALVVKRVILFVVQLQFVIISEQIDSCDGSTRNPSKTQLRGIDLPYSCRSIHGREMAFPSTHLDDYRTMDQGVDVMSVRVEDRSSAALLPHSPLCHFQRKTSTVGWIEEPWRPRQPSHSSSFPSTLKSCLKSSAGRGHRVRFSNAIAVAASPHSLAPQHSTNDDVTHNHSRSANLAVSLMRDKTMLRTESAAWSYAWAYDAAYQQFGSCGAVDPILQRTLLHGIDKGYFTLERFSEDSRGRRVQAQQTRRSILDQFHKLKDSGAKDSTEQLTEHCRQVSRVNKQWASYMGRLQFATSKTDSVAPPITRAPVEVVEKVTLQSKAQRWKIKLPSPRRGAIVLVA